MRRDQFDHVLRAAAGVLGETELLVIGSQALHAARLDPPLEEAERSAEVDLVSLDDSDGAKADLIDGSIGEASMFQDAFGVYAQGVAEETAILPAGWRDRLVRYVEPRGQVVAWCLEPHDLWIAKALAGRPKDLEFCMALLRTDILDPDVLAARIPASERATPDRRDRALAWITRQHD